VIEGGITGVAHELGMLVRGDSRAHQILRSRVAALVIFTLVVDAIGTTVMWMLERHASQTGFTTWPGALFWTTAQLTTVSSQEPNPVTAGGKAVDIALELWAVTVVATLAASLVTFFVHRHRETMQQDA
jgi:hypothetical protein